MTKICWLFLLLIAPSVIKAQYTEVINSNRPGYSESPYSLGTDVFQIEGGYQFSSSDHFTKTEKVNSHIFDQVLRMGLFSERFELKFIFQQEFNKINNPNSPFTNNYGGDIGIGFKYLILNAKVKNRDHEIRSWKKRTGFHWTMLIPSIALDASTTYGINPTITQDIDLIPDELDDLFNYNLSLDAKINSSGNYKFGLLLQNHIKDNWVIVTNFRYEKTYLSNKSNINIYNLIVSASYNLNDQWSFFGENRNRFNSYQNNFDIRTGAAYLLHENLQFDSSINFNTGTNIQNLGVSIGASWRIDNHIDKPLKVKAKKEEKPKKDNFFKRAGQSTKEGIIVAGLYTGLFFDNLWTDVSIFSQNLFLKEENHLPKRERTKKPKKAKQEKELKKPKKSRRLEKETKNHKNPSLSVQTKQLKAQEKALKAEEKEKNDLLKAQEKEEKNKLKEEEKIKKAEEKEAIELSKEEERIQKENKKLEEEELALYAKAVKESEKEEAKAKKERLKTEEKAKKEEAETKAVSSKTKSEENAKKQEAQAKAESDRIKAEEKAKKQEAQAKAESERIKAEEKAKKQEAQAKAESDRLKAEEKAKKQEAQAKAESDRLKAEEKAKIQEANAKAESDRIKAEEKAKKQENTLSKEEENANKKKEKAEKKALKKEKKKKKKEEKKRKEQERIEREKEEKQRDLMRRIDELSTF